MATDFRPVFPVYMWNRISKRLYRRDFIHEILHLLALHETGVSEKDDDSGEYHYVPTLTRDSVCLFSSQPEVLSANKVTYKVSDYLKKLANSGKEADYNDSPADIM